MTILVGAAQLIYDAIERVPSNTTVRLLLQPAEEGPGGAEPMIRDGCMKGVDGASLRCMWWRWWLFVLFCECCV